MISYICIYNYDYYRLDEEDAKAKALKKFAEDEILEQQNMQQICAKAIKLESIVSMKMGLGRDRVLQGTKVELLLYYYC